MQTDPPPVLEYASPPRVIAPPPAATMLFGCGVALACLAMLVIEGLLGMIDIPLGPACSCVIIPAITAAIFSVGTTLRAKWFAKKLVQRNSYLIFALGIGAVVIPLAFSYVAYSVGGDKWAGPTLVVSFLSFPVISPWIAFRQSDAQDRG